MASTSPKSAYVSTVRQPFCFKPRSVRISGIRTVSLRAEKLTQAILAKAFRGELVPTEAELARREKRDYEPASVLLERIKGERAKNAENAAKHKPKTRRLKAKAIY